MAAPKYTIIFSSRVKTIPSAEKDKYLALASIQDLKPFLPDVNTEKNVDLLPFALNITVVNRVNKNLDVINTETALGCYKDFINKPCNVEHARNRVCGTILTAGFSEFGTDKPLTEEEASKLTSPFNITLGGVIWRASSGNLADLLEASADPESDTYLQISGSWEMGFTDFNVVLIAGESRNIKEGRIVSDPEEVKKLAPNLKALGGTGKVGDEYIYRMPTTVLPMGIGLTLNPAADVKGVLTGTEENPPVEEPKKEPVLEITETTAKETVSTINPQDSSQSTATAVKKNSIDMKITNIAEITDDLLKQATASVVTDFIQTEIKKASDKYVEDKTAHDKAIKEAQEVQAKTNQELEATKKNLKEVQDDLKKLQDQNAEREQSELFSSRMSAFDNEYELTAKDRDVIGKQIKNLTNESFEEYKTAIATLLESKLKSAKTTEITGSVKETVVDDALKNATPKGQTALATTAPETDLKAKYAKAFSSENVIISKR